MLPLVSHDDQQVLPFGLDFDVFEESKERNPEVTLLHSLSIKEGELRYKEAEIKRLLRELTNQTTIQEKMVEERAA